jgi:hypothetical protein
MRKGFAAAACVLLATPAGPAQAAWVQWTGPGSNGHW